LRVILDPKCEVPTSALTYQQPGKVLLIVDVERRSSVIETYQSINNVDIVGLEVQAGKFNLRDVFEQLGQHEINNVLLEAGSSFQGACVQAGMVNELRIYVAPHLMGHSDYGIFNLAPLNSMQERINLELKSVKKFGQDVRLIYRA